MKVLIITGGDIQPDFASSFLDKKHYDTVIAVDGGLGFADKYHLMPGHLVGDFDTIAPEILNKYLGLNQVEIHRFAPEKDNTDTDMAVKLAISMCREDRDRSCIDILGALGRRMDHTLANVYLLLEAWKEGIPAYIYDCYNRISVVSGHRCLEKDKIYGKYISLLPMTMTLKGITLKGFKYPLDKAETWMGDSLCVSNELEALTGDITIEEGVALLIESKDH